jgi:hypothetical protein
MSTIEYEKKIEIILEWAKRKRGKPFDTTCVEGILDWIIENDDITDGQVNCIDNIITKFKIKN